MPRRLFKPLSRQRHRWKDRWFMRPFKMVIDHPAYWSLNRRSVTRAFALGLFISFVPIPLHLILGTALALLFRLNVPAAIAGTFLANPFTMVPMYVAAYWVGCHLLGVRERALAFEMTFHWLTTTLVPIWKPFLLGCLILGTLSAIIGYALVGGAWHIGLVLKYHKRKSGGVQKDSALIEKGPSFPDEPESDSSSSFPRRRESSSGNGSPPTRG